MVRRNKVGWFVGAGISYLIQLIESCCSSTYSYLSNVESLHDTGTIITNLKMQRPDISFHIQNYHHEWRKRRVKRGKKWVTKRERVRVNTHAATEPFYFGQWTDTSADPMSISFITEFLITRLNFYKTFSYTTCARYSFNE